MSRQDKTKAMVPAARFLVVARLPFFHSTSLVVFSVFRLPVDIVDFLVQRHGETCHHCLFGLHRRGYDVRLEVVLTHAPLLATTSKEDTQC